VVSVLIDDLGLVLGGCVLFCGFNNFWFVVCWVGVLMVGGVVVMIMFLLRVGELCTVYEIVCIDVVVCDYWFFDDF